jgi:hypothetical protein
MMINTYGNNKMDSETFITIEKDNLKKYCNMFSKETDAESQMIISNQIAGVARQLNSAGLSWDEIEALECEYSF